MLVSPTSGRTPSGNIAIQKPSSIKGRSLSIILLLPSVTVKKLLHLKIVPTIGFNFMCSFAKRTTLGVTNIIQKESSND